MKAALGGLAVLLLSAVAAGCGNTPAQPRQPNEPPSAELSVPEQARLQDPVLFDASASSDPDGHLVEFRFTPGDTGETLITSEPQLSYQYVAAGTYTVDLTVVDNRGATAEASAPIVILK